jgi:ribosomal protein S27AE
METKKYIASAAIALVICMASVHFASALSIGISPSEKTLDVEENTAEIAYFVVSQSATETDTQSMTITSDSPWVTLDPSTFDLSPGEQQFVKANISPLAVGNYTATIKATANIPGMRVTMSAKLNVNSAKPLELVDVEKATAGDAISSANSILSQGKNAGVDVTDAEIMLAKAMEEFEKGNYVTSKDYARLASDMALESINNVEENARSTSFPLMTALIVIVIAGACVAAFISYEVIRAKNHKPRKSSIPIDRKTICPECGKAMGKAYDGTLVQKFVCPKCGYETIKTK